MGACVTHTAMMLFMPVFCPTRQVYLAKIEKSQCRQGVGYCAWGCFRAWDAGPRTSPANPDQPQLSTFSAAMKASCGMSTLPNCRIFFLPSFCFSRSLRLRVMSPP